MFFYKNYAHSIVNTLSHCRRFVYRTLCPIMIELHYKTSWPCACMHFQSAGRWTELPGTQLSERSPRVISQSFTASPSTAALLMLAQLLLCMAPSPCLCVGHLWTSGGWKQLVIPDAVSIEFAINDGGGQWDNPPGVSNRALSCVRACVRACVPWHVHVCSYYTYPLYHT